MSSASFKPQVSNPFATRFVRPGAVEYVFSPGAGMAALVAKLERSGWWGEIIGPHGSGKSTLLAALERTLRERGFSCASFSLHDGQRSLPRGWRRGIDPHGKSIVLVDGYEQLSWLAATLLRWQCRRRRCGLVVTAHKATGLPVLERTEPSIELTLEVAERLLPGGSAIFNRESFRRAVKEAYERHGGNVRDVLFDLYDLYEQGKANREEPTLRGR